MRLDPTVALAVAGLALIAARPAWRRLSGRLGLGGGGAGGGDFEIRYRPGRGTTVRGRLAAAKVPGIHAFFARDLAPAGPVVVRGRRAAGRGLRIEVGGSIGPADRQRARNFLLDHLR